jgi:hypothetical protein
MGNKGDQTVVVRCLCCGEPILHISQAVSCGPIAPPPPLLPPVLPSPPLPPPPAPLPPPLPVPPPLLLLLPRQASYVKRGYRAAALEGSGASFTVLYRTSRSVRRKAPAASAATATDSGTRRGRSCLSSQCARSVWCRVLEGVTRRQRGLRRLRSQRCWWFGVLECAERRQRRRCAGVAHMHGSAGAADCDATARPECARSALPSPSLTRAPVRAAAVHALRRARRRGARRRRGRGACGW